MDTKKGRPPVADRVKRIHVTLAQDDHDALVEFCSLSNLPVATFVRSVLEQALPDLKRLTEATRELQAGAVTRSTNSAALLLANCISKASDAQKDLLNGN